LGALCHGVECNTAIAIEFRNLDNRAFRARSDGGRSKGVVTMAMFEYFPNPDKPEPNRIL
jgi:hypothetical protein